MTVNDRVVVYLRLRINMVADKAIAYAAHHRKWEKRYLSPEESMRTWKLYPQFFTALKARESVPYTHLTLPTIYAV